MNTAIWTWKIFTFFQKNWTSSFFKLQTLNTERKILDLEIFSTCSNLYWIVFRFFSFWLHEHEHSHLNLENLSLFPKKWTPSCFKLRTLNTECKILELEIFSTCSNLNWIAFRFFYFWTFEHEQSHLNLENLSLFPKIRIPPLSSSKHWTLNTKN